MKHRLIVVTVCALFTLAGCENGDAQSYETEEIKAKNRMARAWDACSGITGQGACMERYGYKWNGSGWEPMQSDSRLDVYIPDRANVYTTKTSAITLSANGNLGGWRKASSSDQLELSIKMISALNKGGNVSSEDEKILGYSVYNCIRETAGDGGLDYMRISEAAASCITIISSQ